MLSPSSGGMNLFQVVAVIIGKGNELIYRRFLGILVSQSCRNVGGVSCHSR